MRAKTSMLCSGQLLCIARALLQRAKVLVLDEATAGVDPDTAACLQRALKRELQDCTVITIAHRLASVCDSDRVLVLEDGRLLEDGPPLALINAGGRFAELVACARDLTLAVMAREAFAAKHPSHPLLATPNTFADPAGKYDSSRRREASTVAGGSGTAMNAGAGAGFRTDTKSVVAPREHRGSERDGKDGKDFKARGERLRAELSLSEYTPRASASTMRPSFRVSFADKTRRRSFDSAMGTDCFVRRPPEKLPQHVVSYLQAQMLPVTKQHVVASSTNSGESKASSEIARRLRGESLSAPGARARRAGIGINKAAEEPLQYGSEPGGWV